MLPETSNERMTVPSTRGTLTTLCGRAMARILDRHPGDEQHGAGHGGEGGHEA
jgi:hypothetical protein